MTTIAATEARTHGIAVRRVAVIVAMLLTATVAFLAGSTMASGSAASSTEWNLPVPFKDCVIPAQPM
ncbi:MAG: hypothetical protein R3320_15120 [Nitriliruptorales bacterium]|nr:hypothetical protein [Nitriliruptorales bacterium]